MKHFAKGMLCGVDSTNRKKEIMTKKTIYCIILILYGLNNSSLHLFNIQIPLLIIFGFILLITLHFEYLSKNKINFKIIKNKIKFFFSKENGYSLFVIFIWFFYAMISFFWVESIPDWRATINFFIVGVFCTITFSLFLRTKKDIFQTFQIMGIIAIIHNIIGWYEVITQNHLFLNNTNMLYWGNRPVSMFYNTNNFAVFLFISVFILYALGEESNDLYLKILFKTAAASSIILVFFSQSRGVIVALILGLKVFVLLSNIEKIKRYFKQKGVKTIIAKSFLLITISTAAILYFIFIVNLDVSTADRITKIRNGFVFLFSTNGLGVGAGNIEYWMEVYRQFDLHRYDRNIHSWWMEILVAYGVVIFILYIVFYYKLFKSNFYKFIKSKNLVDVSFSKAIMCIMIGFLVASMVPSTLILHIFHWVFWAVVIAFQGTPLEE